MIPKQKNYSVGIYLRLSKDDERSGESLSIDNQRKILKKYVSEQQNWTVYDEYADDGFSGTDFNRPNVQRLLEDAKTGKINLIICKDLSRFGRNYIQVGQYIDYIFPMYNIRFIALTDNVDTANSESTAMDMMPIMNVFNEWHAANTSKKLKAVYSADAKNGKYKCTYAAYGYIKGNDENYTPIIDPESAKIVRRIFEMRANGTGLKGIADTLNQENVKTPSDYLYDRLGKENPYRSTHLWSHTLIDGILKNPIYIGTLAQQRSASVSYKNHKRILKDESEWTVIENNHEPIVSQELWDKVREIEKSVSRGKSDAQGITSPLSGYLYCNDCGYKMKQFYYKGRKGQRVTGYCCGYHARYGKNYCTTHSIRIEVIEKLIIADIQEKISIVVDEEKARKLFLEKKSGINNLQTKNDKKRKQEIDKRIAELDKMIASVYEDKVLGKIPEEMCIGLIENYHSEKKKISLELDKISTRLATATQDEDDVNEFISRLKKYTGFENLTREMVIELIEYVTVEEKPDDTLQPRNIHIYYKFLDKSLDNKHNALN